MEDKKILDAFDTGTEAGKKLREHMLSAADASSVIHKLGERIKQSFLNLPEIPVAKQVHFHNVTIKPLSTELKPMSIDEIRQAPVLIQNLYFRVLSDTPIGTDLLEEANEKHPVYFV